MFASSVGSFGDASSAARQTVVRDSDRLVSAVRSVQDAFHAVLACAFGPAGGKKNMTLHADYEQFVFDRLEALAAQFLLQSQTVGSHRPTLS